MTILNIINVLIEAIIIYSHIHSPYEMMNMVTIQGQKNAYLKKGWLLKSQQSFKCYVVT